MRVRIPIWIAVFFIIGAGIIQLLASSPFLSGPIIPSSPLIHSPSPTGQVINDKGMPNENRINENGVNDTQGFIKEGFITFTLCPNENCAQTLLQTIAASNRSPTALHCAFYGLSDSNIIEALRVNNATLVGDGELSKKNLPFPTIVFGPPRHTMHNKFCIINTEKVVTGSYNPTKKSHKELMAVIESPAIARLYESEFQELRNGTFGGGKSTLSNTIKLGNTSLEVLFCPDDHCEDAVVSKIHSARSTILIEAFALTSYKVIEALQYAHDQGIEIGGMIEKSQDRNHVAQTFASQGIPITDFDSKELLHRKLIIIDTAVIIAGSANPTFSGYHENDENILVIYDPEIASRLTVALLNESCNSLDHIMFSKQFLEALKFRC